jgi:hypothetical protein
MHNIDLTIFNIKNHLYSQDLEEEEIDYFAEEAAKVISENVLEVVSDAVNEAINYAIDLEAYDFVTELDIKETQSSYTIGTVSGQTDFSTEDRKMLPSLLKNAKISKDGKRYKRIPIGASSSSKMVPKMSNRVRADSRMNLIQANKFAASNNAGSDSLPSSAIRQYISGIEQMNALKAQEKEMVPAKNQAPKVIVTAHEGQDPNKDWVVPGLYKDMTYFLEELNMNIETQINSIIKEVENIYTGF